MNAPICQYKVCSTFDSGPQVGSIGRALEIGKDVFGRSSCDCAGGAAAEAVRVVFTSVRGAEDGVHRIDRHPTMSRHR